MSKPFNWAVKSPIVPTNHYGIRSETMDKVFDSLVPVQMQINSAEERSHFVRLCVELVPAGLSSSSFRKDLHIEITDEEDPYIFYTLRMAEEDYSVLKSQQGLLIDFSVFPSKFVQLIERCVSENQSDSPKFLILLRYQTEMSKPCFVLEIVETNPFKHLCHLSLKMTEGNETQIKKHLSAKLRQLKEERESTIQMMHNLEQQIDQERKNCAQKNAELELLKNDFQNKLHDMQQLLKVEHQTEKHTLQQSKLDLEQQLKVQQMNASDKERSLQQQIRELKDRQYTLDNTIKETTGRLVKAEEECGRLQQELAAARRRGVSLDADFHGRERMLNQLQTKLAVVEQELKDKDLLLAKQQELLTASQEQKVRLNDTIAEKENTISRRESAVKTMTDELIKANDIIHKLQTDMRMLNQKLKTRTDVATEQEKILQQREAEISRMRANMENFSKVQEELTQLKAKNEEKDVTIKSNEQIITYLNKQLNDLQLRPEKTVANTPPWFSTPNEANGGGPKTPNVPMSTIRGSPLQIGQAADNRENDEPLDPKYFQPKNYGGLVRKEKSKDRQASNKPSAYFKT